MNGIINVLKPPGMTSFDVVAYLRGILKTRKIGHTGTLDPGAVGVLPVCIGNATGAIEYMAGMDKSYRAELTLGVSTDTQDAWGEIIKTSEVTASEGEIIRVMGAFVGKYAQIPPMYSAVRINGRKLYELARTGITIEREARAVEIYSLDIVSITGGRKVIFDVSCSKGTYIRTLCADIGDRIGCGGHMSFLLRTRAGIFDIVSSLTIEDIADMSERGMLGKKVISVDEVLNYFREVTLDVSDEEKFLNGAFIKIEGMNLKPGEIIRVYNFSRKFIALGEVINRDGCLLKVKKHFNR